MPSLITRLLVGGLLLCFGHLGLPGRAGSEPNPSSPEAPAGWTGAPPALILASLGESPDGLAIELGLVSPPVKRHESTIGSDAAEVPEPPTAREPNAESPNAESMLLAPASPTPAPAVGVAASTHERAEVRYFLDRFQSGPRRAVVEQWLVRSGRYAEMIRDVLVRRGLPEELLFTAMIESGFNPLAVSRAGAKGLWQFMAATARRYGLRVDRWLDERLDPEKATWAAASYFRDLYAMFGSWHLVQAAYNAGEMRVVRAIQDMRTNDFWQLNRSTLLANETKNFVAAIQAATLIGREPDRYGFSVTPADPLRYDTVRVPPATSLKRLAARAGVAERDVQALNPALRLGQTPPGEPYTLKVPEGAAPRVQAALRQDVTAGQVAAVPTRPTDKARASAGTLHVVKPRETVQGIAKRYGVSSAEIARWNRIAETDRIYPGNRLRVAAVRPVEREGGQGGFR